MKCILIITVLIFNWVILHAQNEQLTSDNFGESAVVHVKQLCDFGIRIAGSEAEKKTIDYLTGKFKGYDMNVRIDTIIYKEYKIENRSVFLNECKIPFQSAYVSKPITDTLLVKSSCIKIPDNDFDVNILSGKIIITSIPSHSVLLSKYNPAAVIAVEKKILDTLNTYDSQPVEIKFVGKSKSEWVRSYNIIATYKKKMPVDSSIVVTAHWDSHKGVGADDNASGTAGLIELSKHFSNRLDDIKYNLVFVATGLEEFGMLGSISYVFNNAEYIDKCLLNLNLDRIASAKPYIEISRINSANAQIDTIQDILLFKNTSGGILMITREQVYFNRIFDKIQTERIKNKFENSMVRLGIEYTDASCCSGVDSRSFNYIGIPYIHLSSSNPDSGDDHANTPQDVFNESFAKNINLSGGIASKILLDMNEIPAETIWK